MRPMRAREVFPQDQVAAMALGAEQERRRIADELHDTAIQQLVLARIVIDQVHEKAPAEPLDRVRWLLDDALEQLRALILGLTPALLHRAGFCAAIEWLSEHLRSRWRLTYRCQMLGDPAALPDTLAETLFQGARELMTNAGRHARARACDVVVKLGDHRVELTVSDDGIGIDPQRAGKVRGVEGGFGLFSLRSRVEGLGGELHLGPREGGGTRATLWLPRPRPSPGTQPSELGCSARKG